MPRSAERGIRRWGQRDFFGAHTYKRVDKPGVFHTLWSGDRTEIATEASTH